MKLVKHRIVTDCHLGFECQVWRLWWPFWVQMGFTNTHRTIEDAKKYFEKGKVVWQE